MAPPETLPDHMWAALHRAGPPGGDVLAAPAPTRLGLWVWSVVPKRALLTLFLLPSGLLDLLLPRSMHPSPHRFFKTKFRKIEIRLTVQFIPFHLFLTNNFHF